MNVTDVPAAEPADALAHFSALLTYETDCLDVHAALAGGHVRGARNLPHRRISADSLAAFPADALFVVYCGGPHCNGADRAAIAIAALGRRVKRMNGGVTGWIDESFELVTD